MPSGFVTKREARKLLKRLPKKTSLIDPFETQRDFYKAILDKELPHHFLCRLIGFEKRSDELPERLTSSAMREYERKSPLKCNLITILGLEFTLESLLAQKLVKDSAVLEGINAYLNHKWNAKQHYDGDENAPRTTPEEIKLMSDTIGLVKTYLIEAYICKTHYNWLHYAFAAFLHLPPPENSPAPKWQARRGLRNLRNCGDAEQKESSPGLNAILNGTVPQYCLAELKKRRYDYSDALPFSEDKTTRLALVWDDPKYPYFKCRGNSIIGISLKLQRTLNEGLIKDPSVVLAINKFRYYNWNALRGAKGEYWTTPEEIMFINRTLDLVIGYLKATYNLE